MGLDTNDRITVASVKATSSRDASGMLITVLLSSVRISCTSGVSHNDCGEVSGVVVGGVNSQDGPNWHLRPFWSKLQLRHIRVLQDHSFLQDLQNHLPKGCSIIGETEVMVGKWTRSIRLHKASKSLNVSLQSRWHFGATRGPGAATR